MKPWAEPGSVFQPVRDAERLQRERFHVQQTLIDEGLPVHIPAHVLPEVSASHATPGGAASAGRPPADPRNTTGSGSAPVRATAPGATQEES